MSKRIEMNYKTENGSYEVLYPTTNLKSGEVTWEFNGMTLEQMLWQWLAFDSSFYNGGGGNYYLNQNNDIMIDIFSPAIEATPFMVIINMKIQFWNLQNNITVSIKLAHKNGSVLLQLDNFVIEQNKNGQRLNLCQIPLFFVQADNNSKKIIYNVSTILGTKTIDIEENNCKLYLRVNKTGSYNYQETYVVYSEVMTYRFPDSYIGGEPNVDIIRGPLLQPVID